MQIQLSLLLLLGSGDLLHAQPILWLIEVGQHPFMQHSSYIGSSSYIIVLTLANGSHVTFSFQQNEMLYMYRNTFSEF